MCPSVDLLGVAKPRSLGTLAGQRAWAVLPLQLLLVAVLLLLLLLLLPHRCPARTVPDRQQPLAMAAVQLPMLPP
eukprot:COSAG01_NODE_8891_length_2625_cov_1.409343_2_plen_75_part_00